MKRKQTDGYGAHGSYWSPVPSTPPRPYYTYLSAACYLGLPFYDSERLIKHHAAHTGVDVAAMVNTLDCGLVESARTCGKCLDDLTDKE